MKPTGRWLSYERPEDFPNDLTMFPAMKPADQDVGNICTFKMDDVCMKVKNEGEETADESQKGGSFSWKQWLNDLIQDNIVARRDDIHL